MAYQDKAVEQSRKPQVNGSMKFSFSLDYKEVDDD